MDVRRSPGGRRDRRCSLLGRCPAVEADWDARGTLAMGDYPIGLTAIRCTTRVTVPEDVRGERAERLLRSAEKYCVVLNTLRSGVPVASSFSLDQRQSDSSRTEV
ncbi:MAG: OsmC family protein [Chloroflexi bacterium]|nr:MAG: OsmC family protein [Chloroflexota bacterium]